jgi:hypothetical protein
MLNKADMIKEYHIKSGPTIEAVKQLGLNFPDCRKQVF